MKHNGRFGKIKNKFRKTKGNFLQNKRERKPPPEKIYKLKQMLCPFALVAQNTWRSWHLPSPQQTALQKFFPEISAQCRKKHVARKNKGCKFKKQNFGQGKQKQRFFSATTRCRTKLLFVKTCDKLQSTVLCTSRLWLCSKKRLFRYYQLQNKVAFCKNMRQVAKHCIFALHACGCVQRNVFFVTTNCKTKLLLQ